MAISVANRAGLTIPVERRPGRTMVIGAGFGQDATMAVRTAYVGNLFFVRWEVPSQADCATVRSAFAAGRQRERVAHVGILSAELPQLDELRRRRLIEATHDLLAACSHAAVVIEARGATAAMHRRMLADLCLSTSRQYRLSIVNSVDRALAWAPRPLPEADELRPALVELGCLTAPAAQLVA